MFSSSCMQFKCHQTTVLYIERIKKDHKCSMKNKEKIFRTLISKNTLHNKEKKQSWFEIFNLREIIIILCIKIEIIFAHD